MAVPPTSPLRAIPQPVAIDVQGFMPGDLLGETVRGAEAAAKLPLLREQVEYDRKKLKAEKAQLDFLELDSARSRAIEDAKLRDARARAEMAELLVAQERSIHPLAKVSLPTFAPVSAEVGGLAGVPEAREGRPGLPDSFPTDQDLQQLTADWYQLPPGAEGMKALEDFTRGSAELAARAQLGYSEGQPVSLRAQREIRAAAAERVQSPTQVEHRFTIGNTPYILPAMQAGGRMFQIPGATPRIDTATLHELSAPQKQADIKFAEFVQERAQGAEAQAAVAIDRLTNALEILDSGEVSGPLAALLPPVARAFANPRGEDAERQVKNYLIGTVREAIGSAGGRGGIDALVGSVYDRADTPKNNAERVARLIDELQKTEAARQQAVQYFNRHGTLHGFDRPAELLTDPVAYLQRRVQNSIEAGTFEQRAVEAWAAGGDGVPPPPVARQPASSRQPAPTRPPLPLSQIQGVENTLRARSLTDMGAAPSVSLRSIPR